MSGVLPARVSMNLPLDLASLFLNTPPPPDLTRYIAKTNNQYAAVGGFGDVYKCLCTVGGSAPQEVAVKALRFSLGGNIEDKFHKMLRRELGIWKRLDHANVVPFLGIAYGFGMDGAMSLVSLWMPNDTLHKFLATHDDKLDVAHRLQILLDAAKGLSYLHSFPIVHGDLNSNNVLLDANYTARLADFGFASLAGNIPEGLTYLQRSTARPGALRWVAPEQIVLEGASNKSTKSDIYSFGCIALQVFSGKQPWSEVSEDMAIVVRLHRGDKPTRPESRAIADSHWDFIQRCWSPLHERPAADCLPISLRRLLGDCPPSGALRELFVSSQNRVVSLVGELSSFSLKTTSLRRTSNNKDKNHRKSFTSPALGSTDHTKLHPSVYPLPTILDLSKKLIVGLQNKIKRDRSAPTMEITENDIVVFVVGPTNSGKSWFTREVTESNLIKVNRQHGPHIPRVEAIRCELTDEAKRDIEGVKSIVFVDTPSFLTDHDVFDAQKPFEAWFDKIVFKPRDARVIYMHRAETDPALEPIESHLREFYSVPQLRATHPRRLHVVISHDTDSSDIAKSKIAERISNLGAQVEMLPRSKWQPSIHPEFFQGGPEAAWRAVEELFKD